MEETLTAHQKALIEADMIVQGDLANTISDPGEILAAIISEVLLRPRISDKDKVDAYYIVQYMCLKAYDHAVDREAKSIGLRK